jgi:DNA gyrase subunit A
MAKQLNILSQGQVITTALHTEMQQSYLEYAMSVIVGRALPDVRDGLKPVHRRILYAMHELGLTPERPYRKCARVVGDVLGKYHPHGDQAVYDALVRMIQVFSSRYPLLDGHGNFGSIDNDPPAAMRYTETRLAALGNEALLSEIGEATVDFMGNFDNSQQEPVVLPAQLPILLLNGCSGIAVGMATNIPPHNLGELVDALIALIDHPDLPQERLFELIPGPDFPTGGEIIGSEGTQEAYTNGRGSITLRGVTQIESVQSGKGRQRRTAIVVTELPYQVNKAGWIEKLAELVNQGQIEGIADLRDESDRQGMRVVIELKRETQPQLTLEQLYKQTSLQTNFGVILLALVDGQPRQLALRGLLQQFLDFREQTLTRRYTHKLDEAQSRLHLVQGLLTALAHLDEVIDILRHAPDGSTAKVTFQERFNLSDRQAETILAMPLRRLTALEQQNLQTEFTELTRQIRELQDLLGSRHELLKALKKDLRALKRKHNDPRRTRIQEVVEAAAISENQPVDEAAVVEITYRGYARRRLRAAPVNTRKPGKPKLNSLLEDIDDFVLYTQATKLSEDLFVLTHSGKAYAIKVRNIPITSSRARGTPLLALLPDAVQEGSETIAAQFVLAEYPQTTQVVLLTQQGRIKQVPLAEFADVTGRGLTALKLKQDDQLLRASLTEPDKEVVVATSGGRLLRFQADEVPVMGRTALGHQALRMRKQEHLVGLVTLPADEHLLLVSQQGYVKQLPLNSLRLAHRGDIGTPALQFANKIDTLVAILPALPEADLVLSTDTNRLARFAINSIPIWGKDGSGTRLLEVNRGEKVVAATAIQSPSGNSV